MISTEGVSSDPASPDGTASPSLLPVSPKHSGTDVPLSESSIPVSESPVAEEANCGPIINVDIANKTATVEPTENLEAVSKVAEAETEAEVLSQNEENANEIAPEHLPMQEDEDHIQGDAPSPSHPEINSSPQKRPQSTSTATQVEHSHFGTTAIAALLERFLLSLLSVVHVLIFFLFSFSR